MRGKKCLIKIQYSERLLLLPVVHYNCRASAMIKGGDLTMTTTVFLGFIVLRLYSYTYLSTNEKMIEETANPLLSTNLFFFCLFLSQKKSRKKTTEQLSCLSLTLFYNNATLFSFLYIKIKLSTSSMFNNAERLLFPIIIPKQKKRYWIHIIYI